MRKLLSIVLCLSMILSIFTCVSVSAETETEQKNFELVAQGGSELSYKSYEAYYYLTYNSLYTYYKFKIPKGANLTSADLTIHIGDNKSRPTYNVTPYVVTDATFWQDDSTTFTAPDTAPAMSSMGAINMNEIMVGSGSIKELVISENEVLKNSINELAAEGKDYVIIAVKSSGTSSSNPIWFVNYFKEAPAGIAATLSATGTFAKPVQRNLELVAQGGNKGSRDDGGATDTYYAMNNQYVYYKFRIPEGANLKSAGLTIHIASPSTRTSRTATPYVVTDNFWQNDSVEFTAPAETPAMEAMTDAISLNETENTLKEVVISENETLKNSINTLAAQGKDYVIIAIKGSGNGSGKNYVYFVDYFDTKPDGVEASLTATGIFDEVVTDFSDAVVGFNKETGAYTVTTAATSGTAMLIVASFDTTGMVDVRVTTINANTAVNGTISGNMEVLEAGTSVKAFLLHPTTIAPFIGVTNF